MKTYYVHIQFEALGMTTRAKNKTEARKKVKIRLGRKNLIRLIDRKNFFIDER